MPAPPDLRPGTAAWQVPEAWQSLRHGGPGPFVTWETARRPDGTVVEFSSRRQRKGLGPRQVLSAADGNGGPSAVRTRGLTARRRAVRWAPHLIGWWIAVLFMIGSACFAGAAVPGLSSVAPASVLGAVFFAGSLFFTSAAYLQYVQSINATGQAGQAGAPRRRRLLAWQPARIDWWACSVQLAGTIWFNINTANALRVGLTTRQQNLRIWTPDMLGSICFLVASWLAVAEVCHGRWCVRRGDVSWSVAAINLLGSVFFMFAAIAAFVRPATGDLASASVANGGTFLGALCFFWGARLLLVEMAEAGNPTAGATAGCSRPHGRSHSRRVRRAGPLPGDAWHILPGRWHGFREDQARQASQVRARSPADGFEAPQSAQQGDPRAARTRSGTDLRAGTRPCPRP